MNVYPRWEYPVPLGRAAAVDTMAGVAAPLLAGFSLTLLGVVAQAPDSFRTPGLTLAILTLATSTMVTCVQFGFKARAAIYSSADVDSWYPQSERDHETELDIRKSQNLDYRDWTRLHSIARGLYNLAIVFLAVGVAIALLPPSHYGSSEHPVPLSNFEFYSRSAASAIALFAALGEIGWWIAGNVKYRTMKRRYAAKNGTDSQAEPEERISPHV